MATKKKGGKKKGIGGKAAWEIGAGITAATIAAAAGAYLLSDKKTKAKAKKWGIAARKEVVKNAKIAKKLGEKEYGRLVEQAMKHYGSIENMSAADIMAAAKELKGEWGQIQAHAKRMANIHRPAKRAAKKGVARKKGSPKKSRA